ncbi:MAG: sulfate adenylyltransferase, partial [Acidimicrobiia bacterium]|nr:sulfate adenylyltransferase [Acidimicrobiia bacterium]
MASLLRFATAGSVDDGKSTLIGRLLHDAKALHNDHVDAVAASSARRGQHAFDLALVTDGLRAEREQGITIDVAYRYAATPRRTFVIADTPGHAQYTRNMVTGVSTVDLVLLLVDARQGVTEQTRRHACVAATLGVSRLVLAVNKMDLVAWSEERFDEIAAELAQLTMPLGFVEVTPIPLSALEGDNVVDPSPDLAWYAGPTLLGYLEEVAVDRPAEASVGARLAVQWVIRPRPGEAGGRRYAGTLAAGQLRTGDEVVALPGGRATRVAAVEVGGEPADVAEAGAAVSVALVDDLDVGRGDLLAAAGARPALTSELDATVCWFGDRPLRAGDRLTVLHGSRLTRAIVTALVDRLDVSALERRPA